MYTPSSNFSEEQELEITRIKKPKTLKKKSKDESPKLELEIVKIRKPKTQKKIK